MDDKKSVVMFFSDVRRVGNKWKAVVKMYQDYAPVAEYVSPEFYPTEKKAIEAADFVAKDLGAGYARDHNAPFVIDPPEYKS